jgi:glycosyltransferase involved in cell wall biosynthesis
MESSRPLVSVFLPTYNQEDYIEEALNSALEQDYENIEIVVGDDHSQDGTWKIVSEYEREYPDTIVAFRNEENLGVTANCNEVLQRCSGEYVVFHAGDDVFLPGKISRQVDALEAEDGRVLCYHDIEEFDTESGETLRYWNSGADGHDPVTGDTKKVARALVSQGTKFMAGQSVMASTDAIPEKGYDSSLTRISDWLLWIEICMQNDGTVCFIDDVLSRRRHHDTNVSASDDRTDIRLTLGILESDYPELRGSIVDYRAYLYYQQAVKHFEEKEYQEGRKLMLYHARVSMYSWKWVVWFGYSFLLQYGLVDHDFE